MLASPAAAPAGVLRTEDSRRWPRPPERWHPGTPSSSHHQRPQVGRRAPGAPSLLLLTTSLSWMGPAFGIPHPERRPTPSVASAPSPSRLCQMPPAQGGLAQPPFLGCSCLPASRPASSPTTSPQHWDTCPLEGCGLGEVLPAPKESPQVPCPRWAASGPWCPHTDSLDSAPVPGALGQSAPHPQGQACGCVGPEACPWGQPPSRPSSLLLVVVQLISMRPCAGHLAEHSARAHHRPPHNSFRPTLPYF